MEVSFEGQPMQASKWLAFQALLDDAEMADLLNRLGEFFIVTPGSVVEKQEGIISKDSFQKSYKDYITSLKNGQIPKEADYRTVFSAAFTKSLDAVYASLIAGGKQIIRAKKPVIQLQPHRMSYSSIDRRFHSMTFGPSTITWGVQFSYPQQYLDPETKQIKKVLKESGFANTEMFRILQKYFREQTVPASFQIEDSKLATSIRIGKQCFSWIGKHPQLVQRGFKVVSYGN